MLLFFTLNSAVFIGLVVKILFAPCVSSTLATPLVISLYFSDSIAVANVRCRKDWDSKYGHEDVQTHHNRQEMERLGLTAKPTTMI